ncbi:MAG: cobalamin biosynthesis protein [Candidatus Methanomethylophilaceae archaeon]|nr:cobalamin biosynthesis protein [Candidatus Methanomethylophilaceae archaeon]
MRVAIVAFSTNGCRTALRVADLFDGDDVDIACKTGSDSLGVPKIEGATATWVAHRFDKVDVLVFVGAIGIAVRYIAPHVRSKDRDPAVICMDELAHFCIPLLSGHIGGANLIAERISESMGCVPVITTATDINGRFAVDVFATENRLFIDDLKVAKEVSARILRGDFIGFASRIPFEGTLPKGLTLADGGEFGICISDDPNDRPFDDTLVLIPRDIILGVGCRRDTDPKHMFDIVSGFLADNGISPERVGSVESIVLKQDEAAIHHLARKLRVRARFHTAEELLSLEGEFSSSDFVKSITSVDCVCERSAVYGGGELTIRKFAKDGVTVAAAIRKVLPRFG